MCRLLLWTMHNVDLVDATEFLPNILNIQIVMDSAKEPKQEIVIILSLLGYEPIQGYILKSFCH